MRPVAEFLRRNLLILLFLALIVGQILMWRTLVEIERTVDKFGCGTRGFPCKVIIVPDR